MFLIGKYKIISILLIFSIFFSVPTVYSTQSTSSLNCVVLPEIVKEEFGKSINNFLADKGFPGAIVSVYKEGEEVINECFGVCEDPNKAYPMASVSKLFTEAAINQLIAKNVLKKDTKVLDYLNIQYEVKDQRTKQITIKQLLEHTGGWDRELTEDPLFAMDKFPQWVNSNQAFLKYVLINYRLDHNPGKVESYSNFGYFLLGQVIEKATGQKYLDYINKEFAEPNNIKIYQAETPRAFSTEYPFANFFRLELATSSFGLAARVSDIGYFFSKYNRQGFEKVAPEKDSSDWWKDGSLPGIVTSLVRQRVNDVVVVVFIPTRDEDHWMDDNELLSNVIDNTAVALGL